MLILWPIYSGDIRKTIAKIKTVHTKKQLANLRQFYPNSGRSVPLDLLPKAVREKRRGLSDYEASLKTARQRKREAAYPMREFALRVRKVLSWDILAFACHFDLLRYIMADLRST
jgi:large subunit ribosomal protein L35e